MPTETSSTIDIINDLASDDRTVADGEDISNGVKDDIADVSSFTVYLSAGSAVDVTVELSPDGGTTWYEPEESPVSIDGSTDGVERISYDCNKLRLTGSDTTPVTAKIREVV